ncbi:MAG: molybdopterin-dependent oxidoreductase [Halomonas subglaciescola]|nr:molybdopterin-dependent oxidoreductase [Halomonas subglaciescola]
MWAKVGVLFTALMVVSTAALSAQDRAAHEKTKHEKALLQITGQVAGGEANLNREALYALPPAELVTSTVVTDGQHTFSGFLMRDLLEQVESQGNFVTAVALNDYAVDIPVSDFYHFDVIVAYSMDGKLLNRSGKGPLWIVYPRDDHEELQDIRYDYRWVWQLYQLDVLP